MKLKMGIKELVARAEQVVNCLTPAEVDGRLSDKAVLLVDVRDIRELQREGRIAGSVHVPRGMLEFWADPESPYYKDYFGTASEIIIYCNKGWRSALSGYALKEMGLENISHMSGGFTRWVEDIGRIEKLPEKTG